MRLRSMPILFLIEKFENKLNNNVMKGLELKKKIKGEAK